MDSNDVRDPDRAHDAAPRQAHHSTNSMSETLDPARTQQQLAVASLTGEFLWAQDLEALLLFVRSTCSVEPPFCCPRQFTILLRTIILIRWVSDVCPSPLFCPLRN